MGVMVSLRLGRVTRGQRIFGINSPGHCVNATVGLDAVEKKSMALPVMARSLRGHPTHRLETVLSSARINKTDVAA